VVEDLEKEKAEKVRDRMLQPGGPARSVNYSQGTECWSRTRSDRTPRSDAGPACSQ
jgi:hypothetical protein